MCALFHIWSYVDGAETVDSCTRDLQKSKTETDVTGSRIEGIPNPVSGHGRLHYQLAALLHPLRVRGHLPRVHLPLLGLLYLSLDGILQQVKMNIEELISSN